MLTSYKGMPPADPPTAFQTVSEDHSRFWVSSSNPNIFQSLSTSFVIFNVLSHSVSGPRAGLRAGLICGAVLSPCAAATWCGPALLGASWVAAGPFCRAAWTAQCCDPYNTPWGTPGTEGQTKIKIKSLIKTKLVKSNASKYCTGEILVKMWMMIPQGPCQGTCVLYSCPDTLSSHPPAADTRSPSWGQTCM